MISSGQTTKPTSSDDIKLGIIGGSGMCSFPELKVISSCRPETKYGLPSDEILICEHEGIKVAFLPRHGRKHTFAPHKVPYKANLAALKSLGINHVISTCIVGSLKTEIPPCSIVVPDQFVNLTWGRDDMSEADGGSFIHLPMGEPYCSHLREKVIGQAKIFDPATFQTGTVAVIQGPRFSTKAESQWLSRNGWDIVNMTQYPECYFAKELGLCYATIATVTDYDVGLLQSLVIDPRKMDEVLKIFRHNIQKTKKLLLEIIHKEAGGLSCQCAQTILKAYYEEGL